MDTELSAILRDVLITFLAILVQELRSIKRHDKNMQVTRALVSDAKEEVKAEVQETAAVVAQNVAETVIKQETNGGTHNA